MAAVIYRPSVYDIWVLQLSNGELADASYSMSYLRCIAWDMGIKDENIMVQGPIE